MQYRSFSRPPKMVQLFLCKALQYERQDATTQLMCCYSLPREANTSQNQRAILIFTLLIFVKVVFIIIVRTRVCLQWRITSINYFKFCFIVSRDWGKRSVGKTWAFCSWPVVAFIGGSWFVLKIGTDMKRAFLVAWFFKLWCGRGGMALAKVCMLVLWHGSVAALSYPRTKLSE